ncbi:hypothetical protein [Spiroplasma endosymbiont of Cantharis nigra]|uniref:hypothetical protein n=1 Tax=Spiroplasma endosymbiont of Cantharis nigra TaxID=3066278 RepID=UPI0030D19FEB
MNCIHMNSGASPIISNVLIEERQVEANYRSESENEIFIDCTSESENFVYEVDPISNNESLTWKWALYDYQIAVMPVQLVVQLLSNI